MIWASLLTNPLVRKFGIYAVIALILAASVATWKIQVSALKAERDTAHQRIGTLETESKQLQSALEMAKLQREAADKAQANRVVEQTKIEVEKNDRAKQNTILLDKPQNKPWGDTAIPDELIDWLPDGSGSDPNGMQGVATFSGGYTGAEEVAEGRK